MYFYTFFYLYISIDKEILFKKKNYKRSKPIQVHKKERNEEFNN